MACTTASYIVCAPKVTRLTVNEVEEHTQQQMALPVQMQDFTAVIQVINNCHDSVGPRKYLLAPDARQLFTQFEADRITHFNNTCGLDNCSTDTKDTRYVLRYGHVLYIPTQALYYLS